jgi:simple sugar transport system permease protein
MIAAGTPIIYALIGDMVGQRAGIISLSVEGSMLVGACVGFGVAYYTQNMLLAVLAAMICGGFVGLLQGFLVIDRKNNMLASGFVLMFFAQGITAFYGRSLIDVSFRGAVNSPIPFLSGIPVIGQALFNQNVLTYISFLLPVAAWIVLKKTKLGLLICSVGERPEVTLAYGHNPRLIQYGAVIFAGALAGIGGAQMSCVYTMSWANNMINGRGFNASALVILCSWKPLRGYMAAYLFGLAQALLVYLQIKGVPISMYVTMMLPYLFTLIALAIISTSKTPSMPEKIKVTSAGSD